MYLNIRGFLLFFLFLSNFVFQAFYVHAGGNSLLSKIPVECTFSYPLVNGTPFCVQPTEFHVNTNTQNLQVLVKSLKDGGYVVVWVDTNNHYTHGQKYDSVGFPVGNSFNITEKSNPHVAELEDGGFVVVWDNDWNNVYGQRYDRMGTPLGTKFQVNTDTHSAYLPIVTTLKDGGIVVVWRDNRGTDLNKCHGRRYNSSLTPAENDFILNSDDTYCAYPDVASLPDGGFVTVWMGRNISASHGIRGQRYNVNATKVGSVFTVDTDKFADYGPGIASLKDDGLVVVWNTNSVHNVYWQMYGKNLTSMGGNVKMNAVAGEGNLVRIASLKGGGFVVVWADYAKASASGMVLGQLYDGMGRSVGNQIQISSTTSDGYPDVSAMNDGGFIVVWIAENQGIQGRRYDSVGRSFGSSPISPPTKLTLCDTPNQCLPPETLAPSTKRPTTSAPSTVAPSTQPKTTLAPSTKRPTTSAPATQAPPTTNIPLCEEIKNALQYLSNLLQKSHNASGLCCNK